MTKVSVLGEEPKEKELKKIQFTHCLSNGCKSFNLGKDGDTLHSPNEMDEIILISRDYRDYDIMLYRIEESETIYFGHWNDGVV